jgi:hypothetical protein
MNVTITQSNSNSNSNTAFSVNNSNSDFFFCGLILYYSFNRKKRISINVSNVFYIPESNSNSNGVISVTNSVILFVLFSNSFLLTVPLITMVTAITVSFFSY